MNTSSTCRLASGELEAVFWPGAGMLGVSLRHSGVELLRRIDNLEIAEARGSTAGIPLLYPWANRLASLRYQAAGRDVTLDHSSSLLHFDDRGLAIHGVPWGRLAWEVVEAKADSLLAQLSWDRPDLLAVFPFPHRLQFSVILDSHSLTLQITIVAAGSPVPVSFGFHPYFGIPQLPRAQWRLQMPAMRRLLLDSDGIPTGAQESFGRFDSLLGGTSFDDGFALLEAQPAFSLAGAGRTITVSFLEGFPYAQVYAPQDKDFIALEPMTAPTNALISGQGLRVLAPGGRFRSAFRIGVHASTDEVN